MDTATKKEIVNRIEQAVKVRKWMERTAVDAGSLGPAQPTGQSEEMTSI
ncbi:hypothetical protein [Streptomyces silvensis]|nr:hypothetical protein [Streptomyces silvensis]